MNSPAHDVALFLVASGVGTLPWTTGWAVSLALEPASPDDAVTVYDTGGQSQDTDELDMKRPTFQVRVRSASYADAYAKQQEIRDLLTETSPISGSTSDFVDIALTSEISAIGRDDSNRHVLTANYRAIRTEKE